MPRDDTTSIHPASLQAMLDYVAERRDDRRRKRSAAPVRFMGEIRALPAGIPEEIAEGVVWRDFVADHLAAFQKTLDMPVGNLLGCGRFGCVYESAPPWVVKFTHDESEGPVWATIQGILNPTDEDREAGADISKLVPSYLRVRDVVRITPNVIFLGRMDPVYGVVREEAAPIFQQTEVTNPRDRYDVQRKAALSDETLARIGLTDVALKRAGLRRPVLYEDMASAVTRLPKKVQERFAELHLAMQAVRAYRLAALDFHRLRWKESKTEHERERADEALANMLAACQTLSRLPVSLELGETLVVSQREADLVFRDLHIYNVGWRVHRKIERKTLPLCMVILDPGAMATPTMPEIREVELLENASMYLRNAGLIGGDTPEVMDATPTAFKAAFDSAMDGNPYSAFVSHYSLDELAGMRALYLSGDSSAGIAVHDHGDGRIEGTALFSHGGGLGQVVLRHAIRHAGVNYLECFGDALRLLYEHNGFRVESESPFDERYAPPAWNYERFKRPNYYTLRRTDMDLEKNPRTVRAREEAMDEMIANPAQVRAELVRILRRQGLSEAQIEWELGMVQTTLGF